MNNMNEDESGSAYIGWSRIDRDLLVELRTQVNTVRDDIKEIKANMSGLLNDHENRIRALEKSLLTVAAEKNESDRLTRIGGVVLIFFVGIVEFIINHLWK